MPDTTPETSGTPGAAPTVIDAGQDVATLINVFTVSPERQPQLVEILEEATEHVMRHLPGFRSANIHPAATAPRWSTTPSGLGHVGERHGLLRATPRAPRCVAAARRTTPVWLRACALRGIPWLRRSRRPTVYQHALARRTSTRCSRTRLPGSTCRAPASSPSPSTPTSTDSCRRTIGASGAVPDSSTGLRNRTTRAGRYRWRQRADFDFNLWLPYATDTRLRRAQPR